MRILVTGVSGAIGSEISDRLLEQGHEVLGLTRDPGCARAGGRVVPAVRLLRGDVVEDQGLRRALRGVEVAYYLIHSMEPQSGAGWRARELIGARNFGEAATRAGVGRLVYLGGLLPGAGDRQDSAGLSPHLASRLEVERTLLAAVPGSVALRASIVIGARSRSFRLLVRLVERMPVLLVPAWRAYRTTPVDQRDLSACLVRAADASVLTGRSVDVAGPEVVSYGELIERVRNALLVDRPVLNLPGSHLPDWSLAGVSLAGLGLPSLSVPSLRLPRLSLAPLASRVAAILAGEHHALIGPLMEGLTADLLPRAPLATELLDLPRHSLDAAIEHAIGEWEHVEPLRAR
ncbi:MAG: NAD-dependent epimerase/dehydratase family protein [Solirubrobacteraceae bacterium]